MFMVFNPIDTRGVLNELKLTEKQYNALQTLDKHGLTALTSPDFYCPDNRTEGKRRVKNMLAMYRRLVEWGYAREHYDPRGIITDCGRDHMADYEQRKGVR